MTSEHNQDITLINQVEEKSHNIESYFYAIFNNSTDPIFIKNTESKFILVNNAFCSLFGVSRDEVIGFTHTERLPLGEIAHFLSVDRQVFETGIEVLYEELLSLNEVEPKVVTIKKSRYIDSKGHYFLVGVIHDITEKKHLEQENNDANRERTRLEDELVIAKKEKVKREDELTIAKEEKVRRADELEIAKEEKVRRADELVIAKQEKGKREDELEIAEEEKGKRENELEIAEEEKVRRADELVIAKQEKGKRADELIIAKEEKGKREDELIIAKEEKGKREDELIIAKEEKVKREDELVIAKQEKGKREDELIIAEEEKGKREDELVIAKQEKGKREDELVIAKQEKGKREVELVIAKQEKGKREDELIIAEEEKGKREDELEIAKEEKVKREDELVIAIEEKGKREDELIIADEEKVRRADELVIANKELAFQNEEKDKRANELVIANKELAFQNEEKDKRADKLVIANKEKDRRADELVIANEEKDKRADELVIANKEKDKRANKLVIANQEKDKRADELVIANRELSLQNEKNEDLLRKLKLAASVFTSANESIMITDATGIIIEVNDAFSRITGYSPEEVLGKNSSFLQSGRQSPEFHAEIWAVLLAKGHWRNEMWSRRKNGEVYPEMMTISAVKSATGILQHCVSLGTDITELKAYQGQLEHIAHFDVLTNLPNRALLADRLGQAMVQCQRNHRKLAVAFMDLDGFKEINDNHGHDVGDKLLIEVSQRMKVSLREGDTLARIGGDEFIAVMNNLEKPEDSMPILEGLLQAAAVPVNVDNMVLKVSASIGVSICPEDGLDADQLMRHADQAMYEAKQAGKNRYRLFDNALANSVKAQLESITNIRIALDKCEFVLHYQPKVNMQTGEVIGVEALIRWQHPIHGLVPPLEFLPVIEGKAISLKLGEWVINSALTQIFQWKNMGIYLPISVNITAYQLQHVNFTTRLSAMLLAHPEVSPSYLELEILETSALKDISKVSATMQACNILGVRFALDDFGTGYSSLTYLKHLPAHLIKIDKSFVRDMLEDTDDLAIVKGVVGLAKAFQRDVIAEGVETIAHGIALLELGCELAQGYGIARPMPADDIPKWFSHWKTKDTWHE